MSQNNNALRRFYNLLQIKTDDAPEEAVAKIMLWLKRNVGILDIRQLKIDDPYQTFEKLIENKIPKGYVNNCKEFAALLAIILICLPVTKRPKLYIQFGKVKSGSNHVRMCVQYESESLTPLDLDYSPNVRVMLMQQLGGKRIEQI
jgi:hypothetical protein